MTKPIKYHVRPAKTQIRLSIRQVSPESSLGAQNTLFVCHAAAYVYIEITITWSYLCVWAIEADDDAKSLSTPVCFLF